MYDIEKTLFCLSSEKPTRPLGPLLLNDLTDKTVTLAWQPPESDGGTPLTAYIIESRPSAISSWTAIGKVKGDTLTYIAEDLREGTEYHFRVSAVNIEGQGPSLEGKETVKPVKKIGELYSLVTVKKCFLWSWKYYVIDNSTRDIVSFCQSVGFV